MDPSHPYLRAASQAIQAGELERAWDILGPIVAQDPNNVEAWFLLSGAAPEPRAAAACLRNVLALDPGHDGAAKMLTQLEQQQGLEPLQVMQVGAGSAALEQSCPYCSSLMKALEEVVACPKCQTSHHFECWVENGCACAATLCDGFSIREVYNRPLPRQPSQPEPEVIVIRKEDVHDAGKEGRKAQEQRFQRQLLLMALLAEEGEVAPEYAAGLPSVDDLLDQIQRDRGPAEPSQAPARTAGPETTPAAAQPTPTSYRSSGVVTGILSIWPKQPEPQPGAEERPEACQQCGRVFGSSTARFCPKCGAPR